MKLNKFVYKIQCFAVFYDFGFYYVCLLVQ